MRAGDRSRVYFIRPIGMQGPVKIGYSCSPDRRRTSLESWSPFALEIIAEIDAVSSVTERQFHTLFATHLKSREWFHWSPEIQAVVDQINAGTFNLATLPEAKPMPRKPRPKWTEEQRRRVSYGHRARLTFKRTGFTAPHNHLLMDMADTAVIAKFEAYLAEPHLHGIAVSYPWAAPIQQAWLASLEEKQAA